MPVHMEAHFASLTSVCETASCKCKTLHKAKHILEILQCFMNLTISVMQQFLLDLLRLIKTHDKGN